MIVTVIIIHIGLMPIFREELCVCVGGGAGAGVGVTLPHMFLLKEVLGNLLRLSCKAEWWCLSRLKPLLPGLSTHLQSCVWFLCLPHVPTCHEYSQNKSTNTLEKKKNIIKRTSCTWMAPGYLRTVNNWPSRLPASYCHWRAMVRIAVVPNHWRVIVSFKTSQLLCHITWK